MSLPLNDFTDSEKWAIILRWMIEKFGTEILTLFIRANSGELTSKEIIEECANTSTNFIVLNVGRGPARINLFEFDVTKAKAAVSNQNFDLTAFDITFLNKHLKLSQDTRDYLKEIAVARNSWAHCSTDRIQNEIDFKDTFEKQFLILQQAAKEVRDIGTNHFESVKKAEKRTEIQFALIDLDKLENELNNLQDFKETSISIDFKFPEKYLKVSGRVSLKKFYDQITSYNPISFLFGIKNQVEVQDIYVNSEFKKNCKDENTPVIHIKEIIETIEEQSCNLLIEGPSGIGKSTFIRYILHLISSANGFIDKFVVYFDCRSDIETLGDLICQIFPLHTHKFTKNEIIKAVMSYKPIFLIDGLDENNPNSLKVISEVVSWVRSKNGTFVVTSRPGIKVRQFINQIKNIKYEYSVITGISINDSGTLVEKYCKHFIKTPPNDIVKKVKNIYFNIFHESRISPLIICLLVYLTTDEGSADLEYENPTELYESMFESLFMKLEERRRDKLKQSFDDDLFMENLESFKERLNEFSLSSLKLEKTAFSCKDVSIDNRNADFNEEALSSVCTKRTPFTKLGIARDSTFTYPHRSFQQFLAAIHIAESLRDSEQFSPLIESVLAYMENLRLFLLGVLANKGSLTKTILRNIISYWGARAVGSDLTLFAIMKEMYRVPELYETLSNSIETITISAISNKFSLLNQILEYPCENLKSSFVSVYPNQEKEAKITMSLLRKKDISLTLELTSGLKEDHEILKVIANGRHEHRM